MSLQLLKNPEDIQIKHMAVEKVGYTLTILKYIKINNNHTMELCKLETHKLFRNDGSANLYTI